MQQQKTLKTIHSTRVFVLSVFFFYVFKTEAIMAIARCKNSNDQKQYVKEANSKNVLS